MPAAARILAFDILRRVETGAWASDLLLAHSGLDSRDAGLASAFPLAPLASGLLYGVGPPDPASMTAAAALVALAAFIPATRAARVDSSVALRE
jgi:hypothetical protein